eukprot:SAG11_NODE_20296_length_448_cov_2.621777_1_plen_74_part_00
MAVRQLGAPLVVKISKVRGHILLPLGPATHENREPKQLKDVLSVHNETVYMVGAAGIYGHSESHTQDESRCGR